MADKKGVGTTFKDSDVPVTGNYVDNVIAKEDVKGMQDVISEGVSDLYAAIDNNIEYRPMMGGEDCYQYVGNLEDLSNLKKEIKESKEILNWAAVRSQLNIDESVAALKRSLKSCAIGIGASALCSIMTAGYWIESQRAFEAYGTSSSGEALVAIALSAAGALGYGILSGYRAVKAGQAIHREGQVLDSALEAEHDVNRAEIILEQAELNSAVDKIRRDKYREEFGRTLEHINENL